MQLSSSQENYKYKVCMHSEWERPFALEWKLKMTDKISTSSIEEVTQKSHHKHGTAAEKKKWNNEKGKGNEN